MHNDDPKIIVGLHAWREFFRIGPVVWRLELASNVKIETYTDIQIFLKIHFLGSRDPKLAIFNETQNRFLVRSLQIYFFFSTCEKIVEF